MTVKKTLTEVNDKTSGDRECRTESKYVCKRGTNFSGKLGLLSLKNLTFSHRRKSS